MTSASPPPDPQLPEVVDRYRTCEFATLTRSGVPIAWPTAALHRPDGTFLITTSIALPQKAYNIRRDDRVALLFSDPTGSGLDGAPQVLVRGRATCPDEIVTDVAPVAEYWRRLHERQPFNRLYSANALTRRVFDWYYLRLLITVTPTAWSTRPPLPPGPATQVAGEGVSGRALAELAGYSSAVLSTRTDDGMPSLRRVRVTGPGAAGRLRLFVPPDDQLRPGPASLLAHFHDEQLWSLRSVVVVGELIDTDVWTFRPERIVGGGSSVNPVTLLREMSRLRTTARGYLEKRSLPRPAVAWASVRALKSDVTAAGRERRPESAGGLPSSP